MNDSDGGKRDETGIRGMLDGELIHPDDRRYDNSRRVWNARVDKHPTAIVKAESVADVSTIVDVARRTESALAIKSGGHHVAGVGVCEDGIVLDLSAMNDVSIDPIGNSATVQGGATWGALFRESLQHGLGTTGGNYPTIGVAGLTLGGGWGWLGRKHGLSLDNLHSIEIVTASGDVVRASEDENEDLFWACRGGGGNFGVVTQLDFTVHPIPNEILAGELIYPFEDGRELIERYDELMSSAPDDLTCDFRVMDSRGIPKLTDHSAGSVIIFGIFASRISTGESFIAELTDIGEPLHSDVRPQSYGELFGISQGGNRTTHLMEHSSRYYSDTLFIKEISDEFIRTFFSFVSDLPGERVVAGLEPLGGAISRVSDHQTAFPHRDAAYLFELFHRWTDPEMDEPIIRWTNEFHSAVREFTTGGEYVNLSSEISTNRAKVQYGSNYAALREIKSKWDPSNLFHVNQNIAPVDCV